MNKFLFFVFFWGVKFLVNLSQLHKFVDAVNMKNPFDLQAAKICNNLALAVSMLGVTEALALGQRLGIAASTLTNIFNSSSARCWSRYFALFLACIQIVPCKIGCLFHATYFII